LSYLLDTSAVSELVKAKPDAVFVQWIGELDEELLFLSVLTIGELEKGIAKVADSRRRRSLQSWVQNDLAQRFTERILPVDLRVARRWGTLAGGSARSGQPLPVIDSLICATCLVHGLAAITRNRADFERCGVTCLTPWSA
jgi:predicted nucleic acid-binding protein